MAGKMQAPLAASQNKSVNQYRTVRHRAGLLFQVIYVRIFNIILIREIHHGQCLWFFLKMLLPPIPEQSHEAVNCCNINTYAYCVCTFAVLLRHHICIYSSSSISLLQSALQKSACALA